MPLSDSVEEARDAIGLALGMITAMESDDDSAFDLLTADIERNGLEGRLIDGYAAVLSELVGALAVTTETDRRTVVRALAARMQNTALSDDFGDHFGGGVES